MEKSKDKRFAGICLTLGGGICWGLCGCFGQYLFAQKEITAEWLASIRLVFAGIIMILMGIILKKELLIEVWRNKRDRKMMMLFSLIGILSCQYTYFASIQYSNAGTATVIQSLAAVVILGYVCVCRKRLPTKLELGTVLIALLGVFLLCTHGSIDSMSISSLALVLGLISAVSFAIYNIVSGYLLQNYSVYFIVGYAMLIAGIIMFIIVRPWKYDILFDKGTILATAGVVIVGTAIAFALHMKGISIVGSFLASILGMVEPVTSIVVSWIFLKSDFHIMDCIGFILILGTVLVLSLQREP